MATTTKTLTPTNQTVTLPDMTERPDASVLVTDISREADAINAVNTSVGNLNGSTAVTVNNYNDLTTTGIYKAQASENASNPPDPTSPSRWYNLSVWATTNYVTQIANSPDSNRTWIRSYYSGSGWQNWKELATNDIALKKVTEAQMGTNFNNFPEQSFGWANNTTSAYSNAPSVSAFHVITIKTLATHGFQLAVKHDANNMYLRTLSDGNWGAWKSVAFT